jgi:hypothetical protein
MQQKIRLHPRRVAAATLLGIAATLPAISAAQSLSDEWRLRAVVYMWMPKITGSATFPVATASPSA